MEEAPPRGGKGRRCVRRAQLSWGPPGAEWGVGRPGRRRAGLRAHGDSGRGRRSLQVHPRGGELSRPGLSGAAATARFAARP